MRVLIIEDESRAARHLERLLGQLSDEIQVIASLESVRDAVLFLSARPAIDLIFSDIQLADGLSFEIYKQVDVSCPIIFTTAYDQYAIEAFQTNGIDYLLKPIEEERLQQALTKARQFSPGLLMEKLMNMNRSNAEKSGKSRFMVKVGDKIKSIPVEDIRCFYSLDKATYLLTADRRNYTVDYALEQVVELVSAERFFRINRKYLVAIEACSEVYAWSNSRLRLKLDGLDDNDVVVARERVADFKKWLDR